MEHEELIDCHKCRHTHREGYNCAAVSASCSNGVLADDGLKIQVRLENFRSQATDEYESYLVIRAKGKTQPYLYIPDGFDNDVLDAIIDRIKTGNGKSY